MSPGCTPYYIQSLYSSKLIDLFSASVALLHSSCPSIHDILVIFDTMALTSQNNQDRPPPLEEPKAPTPADINPQLTVFSLNKDKEKPYSRSTGRWHRTTATIDSSPN